MVVFAKDGGSVLRPAVLAEARELHERILTLTAAEDTPDVDYGFLCSQDANGMCDRVTMFDTCFPDATSDDIRALTEDEITRAVTAEQGKIETIVGGMDSRDDGILTAKALRSFFYLTAQQDTLKLVAPKSEATSRILEWEERFLILVLQTDFDHIEPTAFPARFVNDEAQRSVTGSIVFMALSIVLILASYREYQG